MRKFSQALAAFIAAVGIMAAFSGGCGSVTHVGNWVSGQNLVDATSDVAVEIRLVGPYGLVALGSGFVVDRRGLVVTNDHVVSGNENVTKILVCTDANKPEEKCSDSKAIATSPKSDLALLQVDRMFPSTVRIGPQRVLKEGEEVFARASIGDLVATGLVYGRYVAMASPKHTRRLHQELMVIDLSDNPGGSGGPVFDRKHGELVGVITMVAGYGGRPMTLAVPVSTVINFLLENDPYLKPAPH